MERVVLLVEKRSKQLGKSGTKAIRKNGDIPGVIYDEEFGSIPIQVSSKELTNVIKKHGHSAILELSYEGNPKQVFIKELQKDPISHNLLHFDLQPISMNETMQVSVPIHIEGQQMVEGKGGIIQRQLHEIEIEALPRDIPKYIQINISSLNIGDNIQVEDIQVTEGIRILSNPQEIILLITEQNNQNVEEEQEEEQVVQEV